MDVQADVQTLRCPQCQTEFDASIFLPGQSVPCMQCGFAITVPEMGQQPLVSAPVPSLPHEKTDFHDISSFDDLSNLPLGEVGEEGHTLGADPLIREREMDTVRQIEGVSSEEWASVVGTSGGWGDSSDASPALSVQKRPAPAPMAMPPSAPLGQAAPDPFESTLDDQGLSSPQPLVSWQQESQPEVPPTAEKAPSQTALPEVPSPPAKSPKEPEVAVEEAQAPAVAEEAGPPPRDKRVREKPAFGASSKKRSDDDEVVGPLSRRASQWEPANLVLRGLAFVIDNAILYGSLFWLGRWFVKRYTVLKLLGIPIHQLPPDFQKFLSVFSLLFSAVIIVLIANILYYGITYKHLGTSIGKGLFRIQVRDPKTGLYIGYGQSFLREVIGKFLSVLFVLSGFLMALFRKDRHTLHDLLFSTSVIKRP